MSSKQETTQVVEDIVCSIWKHMAGVIAHRCELTTHTDNRFDGDALNFTLSIDQVIEKAIEPLQPHMSVFSLESPRDISDSLTMPKPVVGTIAAWMEDKVMEINPAKQQRMVELLGV